MAPSLCRHEITNLTKWHNQPPYVCGCTRNILPYWYRYTLNHMGQVKPNWWSDGEFTISRARCARFHRIVFIRMLIYKYNTMHLTQFRDCCNAGYILSWRKQIKIFVLLLILVLLWENERQKWDASRHIKARSVAQRFNVYRLWRSFSHNSTKIYIQNL